MGEIVTDPTTDPRWPDLLARATKDGWAEWIRSVNDQWAVLEGCVFDAGAALHVCEFFAKYLKHSKGKFAGKPFELLDWQVEDVVAPLFGWKRADGTRRFRQAYIEIPKKNGKSTLMAGVSLYMLVGDNEPGAEIYSAAYDRQQAGIVFREAAAMVKKSSALKSRLEVIESKRRIVYADKDAFYQVLSKDSGSAEGINVHGLCFDELHTQKTRDLWDALRYGGAARDQPLLIAITTAGFDRYSICYEQHEYGKKVMSGVLRATDFFGYICAAEKDDDWSDPKVWAKANPSWGITIDADSFARDFNEAKESPVKENTFRRYRLNQWTEQETRWVNIDVWDSCGEAVDPNALAGQRCYAGLDLASNADVAALALVFPDGEGSYDVIPYFWIPEARAAERSRKDNVTYDLWGREGLIELTEGDVIDFDVIRNKINELGDLFAIGEVAVDPWNAQQISTQLTNDGFKIVNFRQSMMNFNGPTKELEKLLLSNKIRHGGNPVLRWMASNVSVTSDSNGNIRPVKPDAKEAKKIDGIVALIMGIGRAMVASDSDSSVYEDRGILVL